MEENKLKRKGPGDIVQLQFPDNILASPEYLIGSLTPDPSGKPCEGACNAFREIIDNAIDVIYENPDATSIIVDTENYNGYNLVADNSWGIPIKMSDVPGKTMANLSISALNAGSKFNGKGQSEGTLIGRFGVGSSVTNALSKEYILLSKITQENYDKSIPAVKELWESQGPRSKKDLFYIIVYQNYGHLAYEGAMKLQDINKKLGVQLPQGMSTIVLFKLGEQYVPDPRVVIPYDNLNYFLLILKEFYKRKVNVIANGKTMTAADLSNNYKFKIIKTIIPEDQSKNKEVKVLIYFDVDPEMPSKTFCGSVNGLVVNTGLHQTYVENSYEQAIRAEYKITHRYTMNGLRMCVIMLAESIGFDSQTKIRLKSIAKVKQSDFTGTLVKEFVKIFRANPEYWEEHIGRLNTIYNSMKSFTAAEKAQKMIEDAQGRNMFKAKAELIPGFSDATGTDRWNCELFLCEGLSPAGSLKSGRHDTLHHSVLPLRGKILSVEGKSIDQALDNKEIFTIFKVIGLGMDVNNVTSKASSYEEGYELIKKYSRFGKVVLAVDADSDGSQIAKLLLYMFARFGRFLIDYGMVYQVLSPIFEQGDKKFYPNDPLQPGTTFPIGLDPSKPFHRYKGLGAFNKDQIYDIFYNPATRRLIQVTPEGMDYAMKLSEDIGERKNLLVNAGIISNPYGFTDL